MKRLVLIGWMTAAAAFAQGQPAPPVVAGDDPVAAVIEGKEWRKSELEAMVRSMGPNISSNYLNDKRTFLQTFALMTKLVKMAEAEGMDKMDPHSWRLYYNRLVYLAQARADGQITRQPVMPEDQKKYYEANKANYSSAKVKVIFINFNDNPMGGAGGAAKPRTSAEAGTLAAQVVAQARAGKDFGALAQQYSDDSESKAKGGDFPPIKPTDTALPPEMKTVIFALKPGQVSDPVRQAGGFWIFRMGEFVTPAYDEVRDEIYKAIQESRFREWMDDIRKNVKVEFKDQKYLDEKVPATQLPGLK
ncbi:MAG TPA: peptidylprolyl isomerase [Paludibaculum sp.]|jgi:peptidyl-prolyl cis-trans isomerase C